MWPWSLQSFSHLLSTSGSLRALNVFYKYHFVGTLSYSFQSTFRDLQVIRNNTGWMGKREPGNLWNNRILALHMVQLALQIYLSSHWYFKNVEIETQLVLMIYIPSWIQIEIQLEWGGTPSRTFAWTTLYFYVHLAIWWAASLSYS